uniref:Enhancer of split malpha protein n=1 Tax=Glossina brevipalpis TaxID=37001 RepID=A0A1A9X2N6_9MUSC
MCQQQITMPGNNNCQNDTDSQRAKPTYSIKKVLKTFFKKYQKQQDELNSYLVSPESQDNYSNMRTEEQIFIEIDENSANEKIAKIVEEKEQGDVNEDIYVPVRFARTEAGTFFWTTNLQPVTSTITPTADEDLLQPAYCYSNYQYPLMQFRDRWAQAQLNILIARSLICQRQGMTFPLRPPFLVIPSANSCFNCIVESSESSSTLLPSDEVSAVLEELHSPSSSSLEGSVKKCMQAKTTSSSLLTACGLERSDNVDNAGC